MLLLPRLVYVCGGRDRKRVLEVFILRGHRLWRLQHRASGSPSLLSNKLNVSGAGASHWPLLLALCKLKQRSNGLWGIETGAYCALTFTGDQRASFKHI